MAASEQHGVKFPDGNYYESLADREKREASYGGHYILHLCPDALCGRSWKSARHDHQLRSCSCGEPMVRRQVKESPDGDDGET